MRPPISASSPGIVHTGVSSERTLALAPATARSTATDRAASSWLSAAAAINVFTSARRAGATCWRAWAICAPDASCAASPAASRAVRNSPSASNGSEGIDVAEEPVRGVAVGGGG